MPTATPPPTGMDMTAMAQTFVPLLCTWPMLATILVALLGRPIYRMATNFSDMTITRLRVGVLEVNAQLKESVQMMSTVEQMGSQLMDDMAALSTSGEAILSKMMAETKEAARGMAELQVIAAGLSEVPTGEVPSRADIGSDGTDVIVEGQFIRLDIVTRDVSASIPPVQFSMLDDFQLIVPPTGTPTPLSLANRATHDVDIDIAVIFPDPQGSIDRLWFAVDRSGTWIPVGRLHVQSWIAADRPSTKAGDSLFLRNDGAHAVTVRVLVGSSPHATSSAPGLDQWGGWIS